MTMIWYNWQTNIVKTEADFEDCIRLCCLDQNKNNISKNTYIGLF